MNPQKFRSEFRQQKKSRYYSGILHFAFLVTFCLSGMIIPLSQVEALKWFELLIVPFTFFYANFVEHWAHKGPMHRKTKLLWLMFKGHTLEHHGFFTHEHMALESVQDLRAVLFPPLALVFFFGLIAFPSGLIIYHLITPNCAFLFTATAMAYYLNYEIFHFIYHLPDQWSPSLFRWMRRHHTTHHDPRFMTRYNFNVTYPIADSIFGTIYGRKQG